MNTILKHILAVILGWLGGSIVNMGLIQLGHLVFPVVGVDPTDMKALAAVMPTLEFKYFIFPFLAHALGTLVGATIAGWIASSHKMTIAFTMYNLFGSEEFRWVAASHKMPFALGIGALFLIGGIIVNFMLPGPIWFATIDILFAYLPMAWLGGTIAEKMTRSA